MDDVFKIFSDADSKTLAIFDIDMVLVQPDNPAFQMANIKRYGTLSKAILKEIPTEKQMIFLSLMTIGSKSILIDPQTPEILRKITQKGIPLMALTANLTGELSHIKNMEQWRIASLCNLGIDFSKAAPYAHSLVFNDLPSYRDNYSTYLDGVLFVNGTVVPKGDALISFLKKTGQYPDKIIFVDDREENLKSVEASLQNLKRPIEFIGVHYLGALKYPSEVITEKDFETRWRELAIEVQKFH